MTTEGKTSGLGKPFTITALVIGAAMAVVFGVLALKGVGISQPGCSACSGSLRQTWMLFTGTAAVTVWAAWHRFRSGRGDQAEG